MSAASPAHNQVRRTAAAAPSRAPQQQAHAYAQAQAPVRRSAPRDEDEMRLDLRDISPLSPSDLDVEGFKPSLLSRLLDLVAPLKRR